MPRTYALLWDKKNKCWFKYYRDPITGKRRKKHCGPGAKTDTENYKAALLVWNNFSQDLEAPEEARRKKRSKPIPDIRPEHLNKDTVVGLIDIYLSRYTVKQIRNKLLSPRTAKNRALALKYFVEFLGPKSRKTKEEGWGVDAVLNARRYAGLHEWMTRQINKEQRWGFSTGQMYFNVIKGFIRWCADKEHIDELPANFSSPTFYLRQAKVLHGVKDESEDLKDVLTAEDIEALFDACSAYRNGHPNHLYILIGLNTGMAPVDIGTLQRHNIHFDERGRATRITKRRTKTGVEGHWQLWKITSDYLTQHIKQLENPTHKTKIIPPEEHFVFRRYVTNSHNITRHPVMLANRILNTANIQYKDTNTLVSILNKIFTKAGIGKTSYSMRKTFASHVAKVTTFSEVLTAKLMAHKQRTEAYDRYVKDVEPEMFDEIVSKLFYSMKLDQHQRIVYAEVNKRKRRYLDAKSKEAKEQRGQRHKERNEEENKAKKGLGN